MLVRYETEMYRYASSHNRSVEEEGELISWMWINSDDKTSNLSDESLDLLVTELKKIAKSVEWDHNFSLGTILAFKKRDESFLPLVEKRAGEMGYSLRSKWAPMKL